MEKKVDEMSKEINVSNALNHPLMTKVQDMERMVYREIEFVFKRLREKFIKYNPFREVKDVIQEKIDESFEIASQLDGQGFMALNTLKSFVKREQVWKEENKSFMMDLGTRVRIAKEADNFGDKEIGQIQNGFDGYLKSLHKICERWLKLILEPTK